MRIIIKWIKDKLGITALEKRREIPNRMIPLGLTYKALSGEDALLLWEFGDKLYKMSEFKLLLDKLVEFQIHATFNGVSENEYNERRALISYGMIEGIRAVWAEVDDLHRKYAGYLAREKDKRRIYDKNEIV